jgi:hypothetical protein
LIKVSAPNDWIDGNTGNDTAHCDYFDKLRNVDHYCYA